MAIKITTGKLKQLCLEKTKNARKVSADKVAVKSLAAGGLPNDLLPDLKIEWHAIADLKAPKRRVRKVTREQVGRAVTSIKTFGFVGPIIIRDMTVIDGHVRLEAAVELALDEVPCVDVSHLSESKARMLAISLNRLAERGEWSLPDLKVELGELEIEGFDLSLSFFSEQELDIVLADDVEDSAGDESISEPPSKPVTLAGDLWLLGKSHRVLCGNSLDPAAYDMLLDGALAAAVLTDPPYNVKIAGNVSGLGATKHGEFAFASGEMTRDEFQAFLCTYHQNCFTHVLDGAVVYAFMDWRSIDLLMNAAKEAGFQHINTAVWYKGSGAMGGFLRSAHEMCAVFCKGDKPKVNNVELGKHGRDRTNVWVYPGANRPGTSGAKALKDHPTPKNLEMCAEALRDVTVRGDIVLDPFLGSGTTLLAAEQTRRVCRGIELDPGYVDVCIRRWQEMTGDEAILAATGQTFDEVAQARSSLVLEGEGV